MKTLAIFGLALAVVVASVSCTPTQQGIGIGAATGATAGAIMDRHHRTRGAAVGAVAGGVIGGLIGHSYEYTMYCPACGRRFHCSKSHCPYDGTPLQPIR